MSPWVRDVHSGGVKIPEAVKARVTERIQAHAQKHYAGRYTRIDVRFKGPLCYVDAYKEPVVSKRWPPKDWPESRAEFVERMRNTPTHLVRMRYFGSENEWSVAFYTYSHERYEPCFFRSGKDFGTPEEAFDVGALYLTD